MIEMKKLWTNHLSQWMNEKLYAIKKSMINEMFNWVKLAISYEKIIKIDKDCMVEKSTEWILWSQFNQPIYLRQKLE